MFQNLRFYICALFFYFVGWILIIVTRIVSTLNKIIKKIDEKI